MYYGHQMMKYFGQLHSLSLCSVHHLTEGTMKYRTNLSKICNSSSENSSRFSHCSISSVNSITLQILQTNHLQYDFPSLPIVHVEGEKHNIVIKTPQSS